MQVLAIVCCGSQVSFLSWQTCSSGPQMLRRQWQLSMSRHVQQVCRVASWSLPRGSPSSAISLTTGITMEGTMIDPITHSGLKTSKVTNQILLKMHS